MLTSMSLRMRSKAVSVLTFNVLTTMIFAVILVLTKKRRALGTRMICGRLIEILEKSDWMTRDQRFVVQLPFQWSLKGMRDCWWTSSFSLSNPCWLSLTLVSLNLLYKGGNSGYAIKPPPPKKTVKRQADTKTHQNTVEYIAGKSFLFISLKEKLDLTLFSVRRS